MIVRSVLFLPRLAIAVGCVAVIMVAALPLWWFTEERK